jgi:hypothetical protein
VATLLAILAILCSMLRRSLRSLRCGWASLPPLPLVSAVPLTRPLSPPTIPVARLATNPTMAAYARVLQALCQEVNALVLQGCVCEVCIQGKGAA